MARPCRQPCVAPRLQLTNRHVCERLHGILTAKRVFAAAACGRKSTGSHAPTYPRFRRDADNGNLSGSAVRDRDPPIRDYLQKIQRDLIRSIGTKQATGADKDRSGFFATLIDN